MSELETEILNDCYDFVVSIARKVLTNNGFTRNGEDEDDIVKGMSGQSILADAKEHYRDDMTSQNIADNTFIQYLSRAASDPYTDIFSSGRRRGYYLSDITQMINSIESDQISEEPNVMSSQESFLYDPIVEWLIGQGYRSGEVANLRKMGYWGNPDVVGMSMTELMGSTSIELVTVEVKTSYLNWGKWIFESISHKRFANRSYFAFAHPSEAISKLSPDMQYYCEIYGIGILILGMGKELYERLQKKELNKPLQLEEVDLIEYYNAPYTYIRPIYQKKFLCEQLQLRELGEIWNWGRSAQL